MYVHFPLTDQYVQWAKDNTVFFSRHDEFFEHGFSFVMKQQGKSSKGISYNILAYVNDESETIWKKKKQRLNKLVSN